MKNSPELSAPPAVPIGVKHKLLDVSPQAIILVAQDWHIAYANQEGARLAGAPLEDIIGDIFWNAFPQFADSEAQRHCRDAMEDKVEVEFERKTNSGQWLQLCVRPQGEGVAIYCRDITKFKIAEEALQEREAELRDFFENGNVALHWVGPDGTILWANSAELSMLGYTAEEYIGHSIKEFHVDPRVIEDILCRLTNNEKLHNYVSRVRCKNGSIRYIAITSSAYRKNGRFVHTRCFTRDVTAERANAQIRERLGAIVESSDDAIISKDLNGNITSWNRSAERLFGYTEEEAIGQPVATLLIPEDRQDEEPDILSRLRRGERVDHFQTKRKRRDGTLLDISLTISPVRNTEGKVIGASKIARDITEQVRNQEALRNANDALSRANADLEQFAYSASHDLQEPLRMVLAYSQMLRKKYGGMLDANADEYIGFIAEGASRMERLLQDLRAFTQASIATEGPAPVADAQAVLADALMNLRTVIDESGAEITFDPLPLVALHEFQLEQLFQNIVGNAVRYRSEAPPRIHIRAEPDANGWKFAIRDNGIGIEPEYKEQIFGMFKRLHTASQYPGTGMGLAICQRIVERAGGRIWVESERGRGSTFFFTIPAASKP